MPFAPSSRHPAVRGALVALALVFLLLTTTTVVRSSVADAQQAQVAAREEAEAAERAAEVRAVRAAAHEQAERDKEEQRAIVEVAQTRDSLATAITSAQTVLDASAGKVADDTVRVTLGAAIATASVALEGPLAELRTAADALAAAHLAVTDAQLAWETEQARLAAEAAAAAEEQAERDAEDAAAASPPPAPRAPATPAPQPAPQCVNDSTYAGPPFYTSAPGADGDGSNGNIPASEMTLLSWGHDSVGTPQYLRTPAAAALDRLNAAYRARFGEDLDLDLTYRSYEGQVAMRNALGSIAAVPGTSTHGTGNALDVPEWSCYAFGSVRRDWLVANGPSYGWVSPSWARQGSSNPEYWHYEHTG